MEHALVWVGDEQQIKRHAAQRAYGAAAGARVEVIQTQTAQEVLPPGEGEVLRAIYGDTWDKGF